MAQSQWSIENFLAEVSTRGLAKPDRFEILISTPQCLLAKTQQDQTDRVVNLFCDQVIFPQTDLFTSRQQIYGPPSFHPVGVQHGGDNLSMQFFVDREMKVKKFFDAWMDGIINRTTFNTYYQANYLSNILISQLDEQNTITYQIKIFEAFPKTVNIINLDGGLSNQAMRLNMTFNFRRWVRVDPPIGSTTIPSNPNAVPGQSAISPNFGIGPAFGSNYAGTGLTTDVNGRITVTPATAEYLFK